MVEVLRAQALEKKYAGRAVVKKIDIELSRGEIVGLLGPNGAGKTTSFYMIVGLVRCDQGKIFLNDTEITNLPIHMRAKEGIGYLPQEASVFRDLNVIDNIYMVLENRHIPNMKRKSLLNSLIHDFGLEKGEEVQGKRSFWRRKKKS